MAYHFIREKVNDKSINVKYCSTDQVLADVVTKSLQRQTFQKIPIYSLDLIANCAVCQVTSLQSMAVIVKILGAPKYI